MLEVKKILTDSPEFRQIEKELFFKSEETIAPIEFFCACIDVSIYAAMDGDFVAGFCVADLATDEVMHLLFIGVHRDYRKTGVATLLLNESIKDINPKAVVAEVPENSIEFFNSYGFYAVDFGENQPGKNIYYATYRVQ